MQGRKSKKELEPGEFEDRCAKWERQFVQVARTFPRRLLQGADEAMARVMWEKVVTRDYKPPMLGEVIFSRTFQANGKLNEHASDPYVPASEDEKPEPEKKRLKFKNPDTTWGFLHALEANKWLWVWAGLCEDISIVPFVEFLKDLVENGTSLKVCKRLYVKLMWGICTEMQKGETADQAFNSLMDPKNRTVLQAELFELTNFKKNDEDTRSGRVVLKSNEENDGNKKRKPDPNTLYHLEQRIKYWKERANNSNWEQQPWRNSGGASSSNAWDQSAGSKGKGAKNGSKGKGKGKGRGGKGKGKQWQQGF